MIRLLPKSGKAQLAVMESDLLRIQLTNFGAAIFSVQLKKENGELEDLVLTCDSLESFLENRNFYGATVGRVVNRIRGGHAEICGTAYQLECNEGRNSAHGGTAGFAWRFWDTEVGENCVVFRLHSTDGESGYPGNLQVEAEYRLEDEGTLLITHHAISDRDTILNMTNHTYWCLGGLDEKIYNQELFVNGRFYLEVDGELLPTGQILSVEGTPFDFTTPHPIGERIFADHPMLRQSRGYDVSFVRSSREMGLAARLTVPSKGRVLEVETTLPDIHIYTGNFLDNAPGKDGRTYTPHDAICLEGERFPDAVNQPHFGRIFLKAGEEYLEKIRFRIKTGAK